MRAFPGGLVAHERNESGSQNGILDGIGSPVVLILDVDAVKHSCFPLQDTHHRRDPDTQPSLPEGVDISG